MSGEIVRYVAAEDDAERAEALADYHERREIEDAKQDYADGEITLDEFESEVWEILDRAEGREEVYYELESEVDHEIENPFAPPREARIVIYGVTIATCLVLVANGVGGAGVVAQICAALAGWETGQLRSDRQGENGDVCQNCGANIGDDDTYCPGCNYSAAAVRRGDGDD
jgi:hypothetical protein